MKKNLLLSAVLFSAALPAGAQNAPFNFNTTSAIPAADLPRLRDALVKNNCAVLADGSVKQPDGSGLTEEKAKEYLTAAGTPNAPARAVNGAPARNGPSSLELSRASSDAGFWDGGAKTASDVAVPVSAGGASASAPALQKPAPEVYYHKATYPKTGPVGAKRFNPIWWAKNDADCPPPAWYEPKMKPGFRRDVMWWFRNPMANFSSYVIGVNDRNYKVTGKDPAHVGIEEGGFKVNIIHLKWMVLPFVSYAHNFKKKRFNFYLGWRPSGSLGAKLNLETIKPKTPAKPSAKAGPLDPAAPAKP